MSAGRVTSMLGPTRGDFFLSHVLRTGSTNEDLSRGAGPLGGSDVLITEEQTAGRGRSGRVWSCPPGAGLMFSIRVPLPEIPAARRGWVGAGLGISIVRALATVSEVQAHLKWPNDVLIDGLKCAGILAELAGEQVVVGSGINISLTEAELPRPDATSLLVAGATRLDREELLAAILIEFGALVGAWRAASGDVDAGGLRPVYRRLCGTLGGDVRIELPDGRRVSGTAVDVDEFGAIVLNVRGAGRQRFSAGDVTHLRMS